MAEPSTTAYAILALLAVRPFTTYELAGQMRRVVRDVWPRAESVVYEEPKKLVALGWARATEEYTGRRRSTRYAITPKGRRALQRWFDEPGGGPSLEFEAMLKVAFADHADHAQLLDILHAIRAQADARLASVQERLAEYDTTGGPYPERLPVIALVARFHHEQAEALQRWAVWAETEVAQWSGVTPETGATVPSGAFRR